MNSRIFKERIGDILLIAFILFLPALVLYWLVPLFSTLTIGNDYIIFPIQQQLELMFAQSTGTFPLYVPGFAEGRSQAALTMGQMYHPLPYLASLLPGYWDGHALTLNTLLRLFSLGLAQLSLFFLFRRLSLARIAAFLISFVTVYNLRMLDCFRYGASLENYTGFLFLFAALGFLYIYPRHYAPPLATAVSTWLLVCGGHPQMMHLGLVGAALACLLIPFTFAAIDTRNTATLRQVLSFYGMALGAVGMGLLLSAAYIAPFYAEFVSENAIRVGNPYTWSTAYCDTVAGVLNSFFAPLSSDAHGAFGSSVLIVLPFFVLLLPLVRVIPPVSIVVSAAVAALVVAANMGEHTPIHKLFWEYVPLANAFRVPGRLSIMLPVLLSLPLAWLLRPGDSIKTFGGRTLPVSTLLVPALAALAVYLLYHLHFQPLLPPLARYAPLMKFSVPAWVEPAIFKAGVVTLGLLALYAVRVPWKPQIFKTIIGLLLIGVVAAQGAVQMRYGTWTTESRPTKTREQFVAEKKNSLSFVGSPGFGMESPAVTSHMERSALEKSIAKFYRWVIPVASSDEAYRKLATERTPDSAVVEGPGHKLNAERAGREDVDEIELTWAGFNRLQFNVTAKADGLFSLAWPNDGRWRATVNNVFAPVVRANGIENAVFVSKGRHTVEFRYHSTAALIGAVAGTCALVLMCVFFAFRAFVGRLRFVVAGVLLVACALLFAGWRHSIYSGDNLETKYSWTSRELPPAGNVAFGRTTKMSSIRSTQMPYLYYAGLAADGDRAGKAFGTKPSRSRPWWQVDLGKTTSLGAIHIYDRGTGRGLLPLDILGSADGHRFTRLAQVTERVAGMPWKITLGGQKARFVRVQSGRPGVMSFAEVEVYSAN